ncbi:MAG: hypothetical protein Tsb005_04000 [Gammaproteobacteria bacterium]
MALVQELIARYSHRTKHKDAIRFETRNSDSTTLGEGAFGSVRQTKFAVKLLENNQLSVKEHAFKVFKTQKLLRMD